MKSVAVGVGVVLALLLGVLWFLSSGDRPPQTATKQGPVPPAVELLSPTRRTPTPAPPKPDAQAVQPAVVERTRSMEPIRIQRDHSPDEVPPVIPITRQSVAVLRTHANRAMRQCSQRLLDSGDKGTLYVTVRATSIAGRMALSDVRVKQVGLDSPALVACIEQDVAAVTADAPAGQDDGTHEIQLPFVVP